MSRNVDFDLTDAHAYFSAECFNRAWEFIDQASRTPQEEQVMLQLGLTSLWHWTQRLDCTPTNLSISYWLVARIYALLGQADQARQYGQSCLEVSKGEGILPFYLAYAYEALARAESVAANAGKKKEYLDLAAGVVEKIADPEGKNQLLADLKTIP